MCIHGRYTCSEEVREESTKGSVDIVSAERTNHKTLRDTKYRFNIHTSNYLPEERPRRLTSTSPLSVMFRTACKGASPGCSSCAGTQDAHTVAVNISKGNTTNRKQKRRPTANRSRLIDRRRSSRTALKAFLSYPVCLFFDKPEQAS